MSESHYKTIPGCSDIELINFIKETDQSIDLTKIHLIDELFIDEETLVNYLYSYKIDSPLVAARYAFDGSTDDEQHIFKRFNKLHSTKQILNNIYDVRFDHHDDSLYKNALKRLNTSSGKYHECSSCLSSIPTSEIESPICPKCKSSDFLLNKEEVTMKLKYPKALEVIDKQIDELYHRLKTLRKKMVANSDTFYWLIKFN